MFIKRKPIDYTEYEKYNEGREVAEKAWSGGDEMEEIVKNRYKKIVKARYRTWEGLYFMMSGLVLIGGTFPWVVEQEFTLAMALTILFWSWCIVAVLIGVIFLVIKKERNEEIKRIDDGQFLWKLDEVYMLLPDRYPKTTKILIETEVQPVTTLQAYFWFKKGDYVYVIKRTEDSEMEGFIY